MRFEALITPDPGLEFILQRRMISVLNRGVVQQRSVVAKDREEVQMIKGTDWFHSQLGRVKWFKPDEFRCPCCYQEKMDVEFIWRLNELRERFGLPLRITSGYRCVKYNRAIGGAKDSYHQQGRAADIMCHGSEYRHSLLRYIFLMQFGGIGVYKRHIHVDFRMHGRQALWLGGIELTNLLDEVA